MKKNKDAMKGRGEAGRDTRATFEGKKRENKGDKAEGNGGSKDEEEGLKEGMCGGFGPGRQQELMYM